MLFKLLLDLLLQLGLSEAHAILARLLRQLLLDDIRPRVELDQRDLAPLVGFTDAGDRDELGEIVCDALRQHLDVTGEKSRLRLRVSVQ